MTAMSSSIHETAKHLSYVLGRHGVDASSRALAARVGERPTLESWEREVRALGVSARFVRLSRETLPRLPLPALVLHDGEHPYLLRELKRRIAVVESEHGKRHTLTIDDLLGRPGAALEVSATLRRLSTFRARMVQLLAGESRALIQLGVLASLVSLLLLLGPMLTREVIDQALPNGASGLLAAVVSGILLCGAQRAWLGYLRERIAIGMGGQNSHALARDGLLHLLSLPYAVQSRTGLGPKLQFLASTENVSRFVMATGLKSIVDALFGAVAWLLLCVWSPGLGAVLGASSVLVLLFSTLVASRHARWRKAQVEATGRERARLHELVAGIATIKAGGAERNSLRRWLGCMVEQSVARLRAELTSVWHGLLFSGFSQSARFAVFVWASAECLSGNLSVGSLVALGMLTDSMAGSVGALGNTIMGLLSSSADVSSVDALLAEHSEANHTSTAMAAVDPEADAVVMDDVWFRYGPDQPWVLRGYSLKLARGEQLILRSASGTGKSTILRLIAGLYRPERGSVTVFGRDPAQARANIAYLPQHAHLFAGSIRHNLRLLSGADVEHIAAACDVTGLSAFVATLPMGLETVVPAGGGTLSGGQRQWILLTAAVASQRQLLLMDESLSHLDGLTRVRLRNSSSFADKSVIWVSHDD